MPKLQSEREMQCPCCGATLIIDLNLGRVVVEPRRGEPARCEPEYEERQERVWVPAEYRSVAAGVFDALSKKFQTSDPSRWRDKREMYEQSALGAEQPPPLPFFDRGTYEELIELGSPGKAAALARKRGHHHHKHRRKAKHRHSKTRRS